MDAWDSFCQTGRISDYLQYKQQQDRNKTVNSAESAAEIREQMLYGNKIPGITVEIGKYPCPGPILEFPRIWRKNRELVIQEAGLLLECR